jgi:hypothetical protein
MDREWGNFEPLWTPSSTFGMRLRGQQHKQGMHAMSMRQQLMMGTTRWSKYISIASNNSVRPIKTTLPYSKH